MVAWTVSAGAAAAAYSMLVEPGDLSLSKTHAQLRVAPDGVLVLMDRGSTNGSVLTRQGSSRSLGPGRPTTLAEGDLVRPATGRRQWSGSRDAGDH